MHGAAIAAAPATASATSTMPIGGTAAAAARHTSVIAMRTCPAGASCRRRTPQRHTNSSARPPRTRSGMLRRRHRCGRPSPPRTATRPTSTSPTSSRCRGRPDVAVGDHELLSVRAAQLAPRHRRHRGGVSGEHDQRCGEGQLPAHPRCHSSWSLPTFRWWRARRRSHRRGAQMVTAVAECTDGKQWSSFAPSGLDQHRWCGMVYLLRRSAGSAPISRQPRTRLPPSRTLEGA
jgi:hypothetical protein